MFQTQIIACLMLESKANIMHCSIFHLDLIVHKLRAIPIMMEFWRFCNCQVSFCKHQFFHFSTEKRFELFPRQYWHSSVNQIFQDLDIIHDTCITRVFPWRSDYLVFRHVRTSEKCLSNHHWTLSFILTLAFSNSSSANKRGPATLEMKMMEY